MRQYFAFAAVLIVAAGGCGRGGGNGNGPSPTLRVTGQSVLDVGKTTQLTATLLQGGVSTNVTDLAGWSSGDTSIVTVSAGGLVTSVANGVGLVTAHYQSISQPFRITVQPVAPPSIVRISMPPATLVTSVPDVQQLVVTGTYSDQSTKDVTNLVTFTSNDGNGCALGAHGELHTSTFGLCTVLASYNNNLFTYTIVTATPPGTVATAGRARLPGAGQSEGLGVPDFLITNTKTGDTIVTDASGHYRIGNLGPPATLRFEKAGYEPAEIVVTTSDYYDATVQQIFQVTAGSGVTTTINPNDMEFDLSPSFHCYPCRLIRVTAPSAGTLSITASGSDSAAKLTLSVNGVIITQNKASVAGDFSVPAGEVLVYLQAVTGQHNKVTVSTAFVPSPGG